MTELARYPFDEASGPALDPVGGHDFSLVGNTVRTADGAGHTGKGLTQSTSSTDAGPAVFGLTANRTISMWIKSTAQVTDGRVFETVSADTESIWEFLFRDTAWHIQAWNATTFARATTTRPTDSAWHFLAGTYDSTSLRLYLDAALVGGPTALTAPLRTDGITVNVFHTCPSTIIDDVRFHDTALDSTALQALMDLTAPSDVGLWIPQQRGIIMPQSPLYFPFTTPWAAQDVSASSASGSGSADQRSSTAATGGKGGTGGSFAVQRVAVRSGGSRAASGVGLAAGRSATTSTGGKNASGAGAASQQAATASAGLKAATGAAAVQQRVATRGTGASSMFVSGIGVAAQRATTISSGAKGASGVAGARCRTFTIGTGIHRGTGAGSVVARAASASAGTAGSTGRDLTLVGVVESNHWTGSLEANRWAADIEPNRWEGTVPWPEL